MTYIVQVQTRRGEYPATIGCATYEEANELAEWAQGNPEYRSHVIAKIERPEDFPGIFGGREQGQQVRRAGRGTAAGCPTADHELVWEYSGGTVTPRPECHAPATADCRIEWDCQCEAWEWETFAREDDRPYHLADDDTKHYGRQGAECNIVTWMDNDEELIEACIDALSFTIGRTSIEPVWTGDWYEWKPLQ